MRKYIISLIVVINLFSIYFWIIKDSEQHVYSESIIKEVSEKTNKVLINLFKGIDEQVINVQSEFKEKPISYDICNKYFIELFKKEHYLNSLYFVKNNHQFIIQRDKKSFITALDSTDLIDNVKWTRFEKEKKISEWEEVFDRRNYNLDWTDSLYKTTNEYKWFKYFVPTENKNVLLLGKSWKQGDNTYLLAVRFLKEELKPVFKSLNNFKRYSVLMRTNQGQMLDIVSDRILQTDTSNSRDAYNEILKTGMEKTNNPVFSYVYNNEVFWAVVKKFDLKLSVEEIVISIPEKTIQDSIVKQDNLGVFYYTILLIISIIVLVLIYRNSIKMPRFSLGKNKKESLNKILQNNENRHLEFKSSLRWDYRQNKVNPDLELVILKTIAAFGNSDGGILLIGVDDDKNILGLEQDYNSLKKKDADFYEVYMRNLFHKYFGVKYTTENIRMDFINDGAKEVCLIEVFKADEPLYMKVKEKNGSVSEKFYVRSGNSSQQINSLKDINDYIFDRFKKES